MIYPIALVPDYDIGKALAMILDRHMQTVPKIVCDKLKDWYNLDHSNFHWIFGAMEASTRRSPHSMTDEKRITWLSDQGIPYPAIAVIESIQKYRRDNNIQWRTEGFQGVGDAVREIMTVQGKYIHPPGPADDLTSMIIWLTDDTLPDNVREKFCIAIPNLIKKIAREAFEELS